MSRYVIVPCTLAHLRRLAVTLRPEDRAEIEMAGLVPRHALAALWRLSPMPRAAIVDGEVAAAWGDTAALLSDEGSVWLFTSPAVARLPLAFYREARAQIAEWLGSRQVLRAHAADSYRAAIRFFTLLGFSIGEPVLFAKGFYCEMTIERPPSGI